MEPGLPFYVLATLSVFSALMVVLSRKPVHSVLYLIFCFFTIGCHYLLLNAQFLFAVHIIVYTGAIMVLFLFSIMFINMNKESEPHKSSILKISAGILATLLFFVFLETTQGAEVLGIPSSSENYSTVANLGQVLYGQYLLPFEIISIMLLAAMVGAVMLGKKSVD